MRTRLAATALLLLALAVAAPLASATAPVAGAVDPSFADPGVNDAVVATAVLPDGKVLIGGRFTSLAGATHTYDYIARLNADGTVDDTFVNPHLNGNWWSSGPVVQAIAVQPDGKILVGGNIDTANTDTTPVGRAGFVRLNADGSFDPSVNAQLGGLVTSIAVLPDGGFVLGGSFTSAGGQARNKLAGFNADGTLKITYNADPNSNVYSLALAADGSVYVGGRFTSANDSVGAPQTYGKLLRLKPDGTLDTSFADPGLDSDVLAIGALPDGRVLAGGVFSGVLAQFNADGTPDATFVNPTPDGSVSSIAVQPDGWSIVGGGFANIGSGGHSFVARLTGTGSVDTGFADPLLNSAVNALALQPDGRLIAGGGFIEAGTDPHFGALRLFASMPTAAPADPTATAGRRSATVSWTAVPGDIVGYMVISIPDGKMCTATAPATSCTVTGLTAGTSYRFRVSAANAFGDGVASLSAAVTPTGGGSPSASARIVMAQPMSAFVIGIGVRTSVAGGIRVIGTARGRIVCTGFVRATTAGVTGASCFTTARARRELRRHGMRVVLRVRFTSRAGAATATRTVWTPRFTPPAPAPVTG